MAGDARESTGKTIDWAAMVKRILGPDLSKKDTVYRFSNNREFKTTDHTTSGIYRGTGT